VLLISTLVLIGLTLAIPYLPLASAFGLVPIPGTLVAIVIAITGCYVLAAESMKRWFYRVSG
jgi:Mg2+-importing ATPase